MNHHLSVLLLCFSLAVIPCICSSGDRLSAQVIVRVFYGNAEDVESRTFRTVSCPWMASSLAQVKVEDQPLSFADFVNASLPMPNAQLGSLGGSALTRVIDQLGGELTNARSMLDGLLFSGGEEGAKTHAPALEQIEELCGRYRSIVYTIWSNPLVSDYTTRTALEGCATRFMLPTIDCWRVGAEDDYLRTSSRGLYKDQIMDFVNRIRFVELAVRTGTISDRLSPTFYPGLVVHRNFDFPNKRQEDYFNSTLLYERLSSYTDVQFEKMVDDDEGEVYGYGSGRNAHSSDGHKIEVYYLKTLVADGTTKWELAEEMPIRVIRGPRFRDYLSPIQTNFELRYIVSKITAQKAMVYYPAEAAEKSLFPSEAAFTPEAMDQFVLYCLKRNIPSTEWYMICRWTRRRYLLLCPATVCQAAIMFRRVMVPSCRIVEFTLASSITIVLEYEDDARRERAIQVLCRLFYLHFPLLRTYLEEALNEYLDGKPFPEHLSAHSDRLLKSGVLRQLMSRW